MSYSVGDLTFDLNINKVQFTGGLRAAELEAAASGRKIDGALEGTGKAADGASKKVDGLGKSMRTAYAAAAGFIAGSVILDEFKKLVGAASDLNEAINMSGLVFKENQSAILEWSQGAAAGFGLARTEALQSAAGFANLFQNVGFSVDSATKWSQELVEISADMASAFNTSVPDAIQAISSGLRGEAEPLRRYGVMLDDVTLKAKALEMGLYSGTGVLSQAARAQAAYNIILDKTRIIQGDFANTADDPANAARILQAEIENLRAELGQEFLPLWKDFLATARDVVKWANDNKELIVTLLEMAVKIGAIALAWKGATKMVELYRAAVLSASAVSAASGAAGAAGGVASSAGGAAALLALVKNVVPKVLKVGIPATMAIGTASDADVNFRRSQDAGLGVTGVPIASAQSAVGGLLGLTGMFGWDAPKQAWDDFTGITATRNQMASEEQAARIDAWYKDQLRTRWLEANADNSAAEAADRLAIAEGNLNSMREVREKRTERLKEAEKAYRQAIEATAKSVLGAVSPFDGLPGADGIRSAQQAQASARTELRKAEEELARVSRYHSQGSQTVADAREAVAEATRALADADKAADEARGMSQAQLLKGSAETRDYLRQQARDVKALRAAELSEDAVFALLDVEKSAPGTIRRVVSEGISKPFVDQLNRDFEQRNMAAEIIARQLDEAAERGVERARAGVRKITAAMDEEWNRYFAVADPKEVAPWMPGGWQGQVGIGGNGQTTQYNLNGEIHIDSPDPHALLDNLSAQSRLGALGGR